ncbi:hypothetical protein ES708_00777 [subsurface metagenome]
MAFVTIAEGTAIGKLESTVGDFSLPSGTPVWAIIDLTLPVAYLFNLPGVEALFQTQTKGMVVKDVHSEGASRVIVEMEAASPVWWMAALLFIKAHWVLILISGLLIAALTAFIRLEAPEEVVKGVAGIVKWGAIALIALVVLSVVPKRKGRE